ncbi:glycerophosphodiester phosphodiesterase [Ectobacillus ponti]|uniref:Glycerophosphodiester phosphodiesterase n=1 Tax=Ectobacillus ponti TaxID=2961894 RepID=A0AA41XF93_9BACI|nr:glycerophosphodiester phosphodiesterase [Ectobacillus ponti]MCP8971026.1 glycerophosphodiester phosphodiesterase [Ectobacillus ponti]
MRRPLITAHTGCMQTPLNSVASVMAGLEAGADMIEVDVRSTKDGAVVLLHDEAVLTAHGAVRAQDVTLGELQALGPKEQITLLQDVLPFVREANRVMNLDVKEDAAIAPMLRIVEEFGMREQVLLTGCEEQRVACVTAHYRPYQVLLNASIPLALQHQAEYARFIQETCRQAAELSCCGINIHYKCCTEELLHAAALRSLPVFVWTVDKAEDMETYLHMGVHSITSNQVATLVHMREQLAAAPLR